MNRGLKKQIAKAFDAPAPRDKAQFVRSLPRPHISTKAFIFSQIPFIKKSIWLLSVLIVLPAVWCFFRKREHGMDRICFYPIPCLASYYRECKIYAVWNE